MVEYFEMNGKRMYVKGPCWLHRQNVMVQFEKGKTVWFPKRWKEKMSDGMP
jgi:hypothetical protein